MSEPADRSDAAFWGDADDGEARRRYRSLLNSLGEGVFRLDGEGQIAAVNDALVELSGYDRAELHGEGVAALFGEDGAAIADVVDRGGATSTDGGDGSDPIRCSVQRADGTTVGCTVRVAGTGGTDDADAAATVCVARQSADDGRPEQAAGENRGDADRQHGLEGYETIVETVSDGVYVVDQNGRFTTVNRAYAEMLGYDREELVGEHVSLVVDDDVDALAQQTEAAMVDGEMEGPVIEADLETADGDRVTAEATFALLTDVDGEMRRIGVVRDVTERKRALRRLEQERDMFAQGPVVVFQWKNEPGWPVERVSDNVAAVFGYTPEELESGEVPYTDLLLEEERDRIAAEVGDAAAGETEQFSHEPYRIRTSDGDVRWVTDTTKVVRDETGEIVRYLGYLVDITERKRRERELRKYETIVETINDGIYVKDADGYFTMVNEAYAELTGYDREQLVGAHASLVVDEATIDQSEVIRSAADTEATNPTMEATIQTADGDEVPAEGTFATIPAEDGPAKRVGVVRDITERKEQRRRIEESERRYRTLAEHFPNGAVGVFDEDLRFTLAEGAVLGDSLPSADRLEGTRVPELFSGETVADLVPLFRAAVEGGETHTTETELAGRHWQVWATPLRDADGEIFAGLSFAQDVTEQVEREQRLEELVDRLEASNERLEQFAYAASHDLQEPLRMVSSYLRLIEQRYADELDDDGREFIDYAVDGADRMRDMIEGLLQYSRVDTGGGSFEPVDLASVLADVRADLQVTLEESDAEITVDDLPTVEGDDGQLRQLFQNLLDNAVEYSGDDRPRIDVDAEPAGDEWRVSVSDDGIGIDPEDSGRVFEVFQRLHAPDDYSGTGIGLALCERIVERHGGDIWVASEPGEGATFTFTLPAAGERDE
ncbi:PAS domain S-box protein [Halobacteria archaeon HArc-gm2]|nr:PAS domain S-box protein [Halobacteria archaeon HArc-gm2]